MSVSRAWRQCCAAAQTATSSWRITWRPLAIRSFAQLQHDAPQLVGGHHLRVASSATAARTGVYDGHVKARGKGPGGSGKARKRKAASADGNGGGSSSAAVPIRLREQLLQRKHNPAQPEFKPMDMPVGLEAAGGYALVQGGLRSNPATASHSLTQRTHVALVRAYMLAYELPVSDATRLCR